jgi:hypothetical protein
MMHITSEESTNAQENYERKPKKETDERQEREMEEVQGNLCWSLNQRCEMTIKLRVFDPSEHGILPWQIKSEFTYTKVF